MNPKGKIPFFRHNDIGISESVAAMNYVVSNFKKPSDFYVPTSAKDIAKIDEWSYMCAMELDSLGVYIMRRHQSVENGGLSNLYGEAPNAVKTAKEHVNRMLLACDRDVPNNNWLLGNSPSCADIMFMSCLQVVKLYKIEIKSEGLIGSKFISITPGLNRKDFILPGSTVEGIREVDFSEITPDILPLTQGDADCVSAMSYNEYWQVLAEGLTPEELTVFKYEDMNVATLEDGLYVLEENLSDPVFVDKMVRFVRASMKGWKYAEANPGKAAEIVVDNDDSGAQTVDHNTIQMVEIAKLTAGSNGALVPADYERTVESLMSGGDEPVITKMPSGAWSHKITDLALN